VDGAKCLEVESEIQSPILSSNERGDMKIVKLRDSTENNVNGVFD
jgi:hypothetical protein